MFTTALLFLTGCRESRELPELPPLPDRIEEASSAPGEARPLKEAIVAFTASVRGEVEVCGCPTTPYGGFSRRSRLYERVRGVGVPFFAVDAGEMLVKGLTARDEVDRKVRAESVLGLAKGAGLDAWAASPVDLTPGGPELLLSAGALAANWDPPFAPAQVVERDGVRLGFLGLAGDPPGAGAAVPLDAVLGKLRAAMSAEADAWFVLSNADRATNIAVAEALPDLAAVLAAQGDTLDPPLSTRGAPIVETPSRGRYVSLLHLSLASKPGPLQLEERGIWKDVATARTGRPTDSPSGEAARTAELKADRARLAKRTDGRNVGFVESFPLAADLDGESKVDAELARFRALLVSSAGARSTEPTANPWGTASGCATCHQDRVAAWSFDPHSRAWESLVERKSTENPECVSCHSTAFGQPGGFGTLEAGAVSRFKDVQCEACHGPMGGHTGRGGPGSQPIREATCLSCHDEANSPAFEYTRYLSQVSCSEMAKAKEPDAPVGAP